MPELPEVETLRRGLAARITGMHITAVEIGDPKIFDGPGDAIKHGVSASSGSASRTACTTTTRGDSAGSARPAPTRA